MSLDRVLEFQRRSVELVAEEVVEIPEGWVVRSRSLPAVWSLNFVRLDKPATYEEAVSLCDRHLEGAGYRQLYVDHEPSARTLAEALGVEGWEVDVEVHMELAGGPDREVDTGGVIEPGEDETLALMERWAREDETLHLTNDGMRQLMDYNRLTWRARQAARLGLRDEDGRLAGVTLLFSDGAVAQVEDVYAIPEARGRGYGRTLVTHAVQLARQGGHELTFIVADDDDWPKELYQKVGFEPVGRTWLFHRELPAASRGR